MLNPDPASVHVAVCGQQSVSAAAGDLFEPCRGCAGGGVDPVDWVDWGLL